jgi:hypothetical protein
MSSNGEGVRNERASEHMSEEGRYKQFLSDFGLTLKE